MDWVGWVLGWAWADARMSGWGVQPMRGEKKGTREELRVDLICHVNASTLNGHFKITLIV